MSLSSGQSAFAQRTHSISLALGRAFPTPVLLTPAAAGVDISDSSIKWIVLSPQQSEHKVILHGDVPLEQGIVTGGIVRDAPRLAAVLRDVRERLGKVACAHAALPEEAAYVFSMYVPRGTTRQQALRMVEFELEDRVPIPPGAAVFDFSTILPRSSEASDELSVVVFPHDVAQAYADAFDAAGITLLSLEIEASSIARAVSSRAPDEPITLLVDIGRARTGFAVVTKGYPIFTSTVEVGGDLITDTLTQALGLSPDKIVEYKNEHGLVPEEGGKNEKAIEALTPVAAAIADEIARHYHYWDTRRNEKGERMTPVGKVVLVGGSANLRGFPEYIASRVHAPTELGNVWQHVAPFSTYVPPIDKRESLQYATAIGLALRGI
jgi:type IV pilus assembly protein PilM